ncbi:MAG: hypothetical protein HYV09_38625 [Deltaproteobacteria bacterium]|nr:hypothetical protein [Deltaproteobacteria bacterium]
MNRPLLVAALLAASTTAIHVFVGTPEIAAPLLRSAIAPEVKLVLYACWHVVSCVLALSAGALFFAAHPARTVALRPLVTFVSWIWLASALVFVLVALLQSGPKLPMLLALPQWSVLGLTGALALWAARRAVPDTDRA